MKKLIIFIAALLFVVTTFGQSIYTVKSLKSSVDFYLDVKKDLTFFQVNGSSADTIGVADSTWIKTFSVDNLYDALKSTAKMTLDSLAGTPTISVTQEGKDFWDDAWTVILTKTWAGTTGDTTLLFDGSTAKHYRFYRYNVDYDAKVAGKAKITSLHHKFYK
jgi:hypothetical protein